MASSLVGRVANANYVRSIRNDLQRKGLASIASEAVIALFIAYAVYSIGRAGADMIFGRELRPGEMTKYSEVNGEMRETIVPDPNYRGVGNGR